jgi:hypothetical protein
MSHFIRLALLRVTQGVLIVSLWCASELGAAGGIAAQRIGVSDSGFGLVKRRIETLSPLSGPPGTVVTLRTGGLPALTPLRIGVGAVRFGFEEVAQVMTDMQGGIDLTVEVPAWAERDRAHVFIVFDFYFVPIALSSPFHVTGPDGTVLRRGQVREDGDCLTLLGDDGISYALGGELPTAVHGAPLTVEGTVRAATSCGDTLIQVVRARLGGH